MLWPQHWKLLCSQGNNLRPGLRVRWTFRLLQNRRDVLRSRLLLRSRDRGVLRRRRELRPRRKLCCRWLLSRISGELWSGQMLRLSILNLLCQQRRSWLVMRQGGDLLRGGMLWFDWDMRLRWILFNNIISDEHRCAYCAYFCYRYNRYCCYCYRYQWSRRQPRLRQLRARQLEFRQYRFRQLRFRPRSAALKWCW